MRKLAELTQKYYSKGLNIVDARAKALERIEFIKSVDSMKVNETPKRALTC